MQTNGTHLDLLWIDVSGPMRIPCEGAVYIDETWLTIVGPEPIEIDVDLIYCEEDERWFAPLPLIEEVMAEMTWAPDDITAFGVEGETVQAGLWLNLEQDPVPWSVYAAAGERLRQQREMPPPAEDEVAALDVLPHVWEVGVRATSWVYDEEGTPVPTYVALVAEHGTGFARQVEVKSGDPHTAEDLTELLYKAAVRSDAGQPGRPRLVRVADADLAEALQQQLQAVGIPVEAAATPLLDDVFEEMLHALQGRTDRPVFVDYNRDELRTFFDAARAFFNEEPWEQLDGDKFIAFRVDDRPWGYLSVLGQMGEEFGVSYFEDWFQVCRFIHNQPTLFEALSELETGESKQLAAAEWIEGVTLEERTGLHPEDARHLDTLNLKPLGGGLYPIPRHYSAGGLGPLRLPLGVYAAVLEALAVVVGRRTGARITSITKTIEVEGGVQVILRYVADGTEALAKPVPGCRMVVEGVDPDEPYRSSLPAGRRIEVDAPGDTPSHRVVAAIKKETDALGDKLWAEAVLEGELSLWSDYNGRGGPSPPLIDLARRPNLALQVLLQAYPMQVMKRVGKAVEDIQVRLVGDEDR